MDSFGTILFVMVPKAVSCFVTKLNCFGTILFVMVPKGTILKQVYNTRFGTILFVMVPKEAINEDGSINGSGTIFACYNTKHI